MVTNNRLRLVVSALAIAFLGTACDMNAAAAASNDDCQVTLDYEISCPTADRNLGIKTN